MNLSLHVFFGRKFPLLQLLPDIELRLKLILLAFFSIFQSNIEFIPFQIVFQNVNFRQQRANRWWTQLLIQLQTRDEMWKNEQFFFHLYLSIHLFICYCCNSSKLKTHSRVINYTKSRAAAKKKKIQLFFLLFFHRSGIFHFRLQEGWSFLCFSCFFVIVFEKRMTLFAQLESFLVMEGVLLAGC